jgi:thiamine pyrophosphokinase
MDITHIYTFSITFVCISQQEVQHVIINNKFQPTLLPYVKKKSIGMMANSKKIRGLECSELRWDFMRVYVGCNAEPILSKTVMFNEVTSRLPVDIFVWVSSPLDLIHETSTYSLVREDGLYFIQFTFG